MAYTKPQQWKKETSKRLKGERDKIKCIDLRSERLQVVTKINKHNNKIMK